MIEHDDDGEYAGGDEDRVPEWEIGLPTGDDLTPLSQSMVSSILSLAFSIAPERSRTVQDVNRESRNTISSLRTNGSSRIADESSPETAVSAEEEADLVGSSCPVSDPKKSDGVETAEELDSELFEDPPGKCTPKRQRLVWTPQLHKRFVDVVAHLGIKEAVPKTIMQIMNVEGLTRENVASHLQKYRLFLKRYQPNPSSPNRLFSKTPAAPFSLGDGGGGGASAANRVIGNYGIPVSAPVMMTMPVYERYMEGYYHK
ncbi:unnamed protein product [Cochlearia groenlandica]